LKRFQLASEFFLCDIRVSSIVELLTLFLLPPRSIVHLYMYVDQKSVFTEITLLRGNIFTFGSCFQSTMRPSNLLKTLVVADLLGESDLRRLSFDKLIWDFTLAISNSNSNGLAEVSFDLFEELVDHPHLRVSSEIDVYQAISDWSVSYTIFGGFVFFD
jgi:hypothetical protein